MNPFFLTAFMYLGLAMLVAAAAALNHLGLMLWLSGLQWFRIHFITLGIVTEFAFGLLPILVANKHNRSVPQPRLLNWLVLTAGISVLLIGIPLVNPVLLSTGGGLVFLAVVLLIRQLLSLGANVSIKSSGSTKFYITGLLFLLLGITVGTGLWQSWLGYFAIGVPLEVHIHANNWGFVSLVFAGLLFDLVPGKTGKPLASARAMTSIYICMTFGATGLVLGPWLASKAVTAPGLIIHTVGTVWLLSRVVRAFAPMADWAVGVWHLLSAYIWLLAPILVAPLVLFDVAGIPAARVEQNAPEALIYGWVLQFSYALLPYVLRRVVSKEENVALGGSWFSLLSVHVGGLLLWSSIFFVAQEGTLQGLAYGLWALSALPIIWQVWRAVNDTAQLEPFSNTLLSDSAEPAD